MLIGWVWGKYNSSIKDTTYYKVFSPLVIKIFTPMWFYSLLAGALLYAQYQFHERLGDETCTMFVTFGVAIVAAGVWASVTKSDMMRGIFSEEISNVFYQKNQLSERKDIGKIWSNVTKAMYKANFPDIHEEITKKIEKYYLPGDHDHYNKKMVYSMEIVWANQEHTYFKIIEDEITHIEQPSQFDQFKIDFSAIIDIDADEEAISTVKTHYEFQSMKINKDNIDLTKGVQVLKPKHELSVKYSSPQEIVGAKKYKITKREIKIMSLKANPYKSFKANVFNEEFEVNIRYPKDMSIDFLEMGTSPFADNGSSMKETDHNLMKKETKEILFAGQGFCLFMKKL